MVSDGDNMILKLDKSVIQLVFSDKIISIIIEPPVIYISVDVLVGDIPSIILINALLSLFF